MAVLAVICDARPFVPPGRRQTSAVFPSICFTFAILLGWGLGPAVRCRRWRWSSPGWRMRHAAVADGVQRRPVRVRPRRRVRGDPARPGRHFSGGRLHWTDVVAVGGAALAWFVVNYGLVSGAVRLRFGGRLVAHRCGRGCGFELLSTGSLLLLAPVLVAAARASAALIPLVLVPLFAVYRMARLTAEQEQLAAADPLTGLPNRKALLTEVAEQVHVHAERAARGEPDGQLRAAADRPGPLQARQRRARARRRRPAAGRGRRAGCAERAAPTTLIARLGGDEFAIVATGLTDVGQAPGVGRPGGRGAGRAGAARRAAAGRGRLDRHRALPRARRGLRHPDAPRRRGDVRRQAPRRHGGRLRARVRPQLRRAARPPRRPAPRTGGATGPCRRRRRPAPQSPESDPDGPGPRTGRRWPRRQRTAGAQGEIGERGAGPGPGDLRTAAATAGPAADWRRLASPPGGRSRTGTSSLGASSRRLMHAGAAPTRRCERPDRPGRDGRPRRSGDRSGPGSGDAGRGPAESADRERRPRRQGSPAASAARRPGTAAAARSTGGTADDGRPTTPARSPCTTSRRSPSRPARWSASRRCCAGGTRARGMVDPEELIRVAEQSAVMRLLTRRVVDDVVEQLAKWRGGRHRPARGAQRQRARPAHRRDRRPDRRPAGPLGVRAGPAPAGDHRGRADGRPAPGAGHHLPAAPDRGGASRWTTSAPATPRCSTCAGCRWPR